MTYKKGQSGNPAGRPKGAKSREISAYFLEELSKKIMSGEEEITQLELIIKQIVTDAIGGKDKAREMVFDRAFGKAREYVETTVKEVKVIDKLDDGEIEEEENESDNSGGSETTS